MDLSWVTCPFLNILISPYLGLIFRELLLNCALSRNAPSQRETAPVNHVTSRPAQRRVRERGGNLIAERERSRVRGQLIKVSGGQVE